MERNRSFNIPNGKTAFGTTIPVRGNGISVGLTNGITNAGLNSGFPQDYPALAISGGYGQPVSNSWVGSSPVVNGKLGITTDASKSGIVADISAGATVIIKY